MAGGRPFCFGITTTVALVGSGTTAVSAVGIGGSVSERFVLTSAGKAASAAPAIDAEGVAAAMGGSLRGGVSVALTGVVKLTLAIGELVTSGEQPLKIGKLAKANPRTHFDESRFFIVCPSSIGVIAFAVIPN
jgi:hypothetical protein